MRFLRLLGVVSIVAILLSVFFPELKRSIERLFYPLEYTDIILAAQSQYRLDSFLIAAVIYEESKFDPTSRSAAGAVGLMQVMPATGRWVAERRGRIFREADLLEPDVNIDIGSWYIRYLQDKYGNENLALAAYNGGTENVDRWMSQGGAPETTIRNIPFRETREFIARVNKTREKYRELYADELD